MQTVCIFTHAHAHKHAHTHAKTHMETCVTVPHRHSHAYHVWDWRHSRWVCVCVCGEAKRGCLRLQQFQGLCDCVWYLNTQTHTCTPSWRRAQLHCIYSDTCKNTKQHTHGKIQQTHIKVYLSTHTYTHTNKYICAHERSNYTHTHKKETPTPCGCDPMTLLSHTVPICHREAQREGTGWGERLSWGRGRLDFGGGEAGLWGNEMRVCWSTGETWNREREKERNSLHGKFSVHFCTDVLFEAPRSSSGFDPSLFFVCVCVEPRHPSFFLV